LDKIAPRKRAGKEVGTMQEKKNLYLEKLQQVLNLDVPSEDLEEMKKASEKITRNINAAIAKTRVGTFALGSSVQVDLPKEKKVSGSVERISTSSVSIKLSQSYEGKKKGDVIRVPLANVKKVTKL
jgi:hypothetical protein